VTTTDRERFLLWTYQAGIDAAAGDRAAVQGDHACLKWTFDRIRATVPDAAAVDRALKALGTAAERGDLPTIKDTTADLSGLLGQ
jgi:hypothetical protein